MAKIIIAHSYYRQPGGEDRVFEQESKLLEEKGHDIVRFIKYNEEMVNDRPYTALKKTVWNKEVYGEIRDLIRAENAKLIHFHNTFPLISPAAYYAAKKEGVAVVQTLHNYRLICSNGLLMRQGNVCEDCINKFLPWPGLVHACYMDSRLATVAVSTMLVFHRALRSWKRYVDLFIVPSRFTRNKYIEAGFPANKMVTKPNFVLQDYGVGQGDGKYAVFVGRLSAEKGIEVLLEAWNRLSRDYRLVIIGDGPLRSMVEKSALYNRNIIYKGNKSVDDVFNILGRSSFLVMPSISYETFGKTIIEAFSRGTPVLVSNIGAISELVEEGKTGKHFLAGDPEDLADKVRWMQSHPEARKEMGENARQVYLEKYTSEENYNLLMQIYHDAIEDHA